MLAIIGMNAPLTRLLLPRGPTQELALARIAQTTSEWDPATVSP